MNDKVLSIIIPMYNSEKFIKKALDSLTAVATDTFEVIVVNDGSTDLGPDLVHYYESNFPNKIRMINQSNNGHGSTINNAISKCKGRFFRVLDADDWVKPEALKAFIEELYNVETDIVVTGYYTYDIETNKEVLHNIQTSVSKSPITIHELSRNWNSVINGFTLHGITYKTSFYRSLPYKLPEKTYYDDTCYVTLFARHAMNITLLDIPVYVYRIGDVSQSVSDSSRVKKIDQLEKIIEVLLHSNIIPISDDGLTLSNKKTLSVISDYLITTLIMFPNRKLGRKKAKKLKKIVLTQRNDLAKAFNKRFYSLMILHLLYINRVIVYKMLNLKNKINSCS